MCHNKMLECQIVTRFMFINFILIIQLQRFYAFLINIKSILLSYMIKVSLKEKVISFE